MSKAPVTRHGGLGEEPVRDFDSLNEALQYIADNLYLEDIIEADSNCQERS